MMAASKCNPVKNIAEVCARDVQTVADETCDNAAPSTDEKGSRFATVGVYNVESPVCDNAGPVCVTKILVNQIDGQDRRDETGANQASGPDRRRGTRPNLGRNQCRTSDMGDESGMCKPVSNRRDTQTVTNGTRDESALSAEWEDPQMAPFDVFPIEERDHNTTGLACATGVPGKQMAEYGVTATDKEIKNEKAAATDKEIKTEEAGVTAKEIKTEEAGVTDKEVKTEKAGATDEKIRTEEAGATDKEIKTEKAGATDEKIRTEEAGGKQGGVKDGGNLDAKGAGSQVAKLPDVTTTTKEGKIEDAGDEQVCIKEGGDLYAEDVEV
ncbi:hypothetical protein PF001_g25249 [Phytophthora fragariae]|uniref:Uncharacterized protein n=1 Tax=Phytophthora fragariae TaxID=53985 RepID=A0A6A3DWS3_9STRA|nr:hypothetical protein PF003_g27327 [Phytophthora fragariae]KAE8924576.1 hypothetical protein PF009_g25193 [Phytophthora fragariae]KAE8968508.1 hypothetical protein PF011_g27153 [Phytophthora fragariae]KAE9278259.1 hypothetical protein PF001_g25249 [Phytophthora fragariae]